MNEKPRLAVVQVPWQISPSVPELKLVISETREDTRVWANANFLQGQTAEIRRVVMSFGRTPHVRFAPSWSDTQVVQEVEYDWSAVPKLDLARLEESQEEFLAAWKGLGFCPDSGVYEVQNSAWGSEISGSPHLRHFLIIGHDAYIEILAANWTWKFEEFSMASPPTEGLRGNRND